MRTIPGVGIGCALSHRASRRENVEADLAGNPDLGALILLPDVRIVAMHLIEHRMPQRTASSTA